MSPDIRRPAKRFIYGVIFACFWVLIFYGVYLFFLKQPVSCFDNKQNQDETEIDCGGICPACELKTLKPIEVLSVKNFFFNGQTVLVQLKNPNPTYAAFDLPFTIEIYDASGAIIQTVVYKTFLYAGENKYIIRELPSTTGDINIKIVPGMAVWKTAADFTSPDMTFNGVASRLGENNKVIVSGNLQNNETLLFPLIAISALLYDSGGNLISISKTEIRDVTAFEDRFFQIEHPNILNLDLSKTKLFFEAKRP